MKLLTRKVYDDFESDFYGDTIVLMGNGKSLTEEKLNIILNSDYPVFAVNRFFLSFKENRRLPDFYAISDESIFGSGLPNVLSKIKYKFVPMRFKNIVDDNWYFVNHISRNNSNYLREFSKQASKVTYGGYTVIFFALQILFESQFNNILLIGCDNNYDLSLYKNTEKNTSNGKGVIYNSHKSNHFVNNYFTNGEHITAVYPEEQNRSFILADHAYTSNNKKIINLSDISKIPIQQDEFFNWFF